MLDFSTKVGIPKFPIQIEYDDSILCIGSCFSEHIARKLSLYHFKTHSNPFGITYNPVSIASGLEQIQEATLVSSEQLIYRDECFHNFDFHSQFSHPKQSIALQQMNTSISTARKFLQKTNFLIITLGTANAFRLKSTKSVVNNCHKLPGETFQKKMLSVEEVYQVLNDVLNEIFQFRPRLQVILTVSPVRHIRDGAISNQQSKSTLLIASNKLAEHNNIHYFPSYEIMMDELRDYRYYQNDMIHPSNLAIDYIWERFQSTFFDKQTKEVIKKVKKIQTASAHRPQYPKSEAHQQFIKHQFQKIEELIKEYPFLDKEKLRAGFLAHY